MGWDATITVNSLCCGIEDRSRGYKHPLKALYVNRCSCDVMRIKLRGEVSTGYGFPTRLFAKGHEGRVILDVRFSHCFENKDRDTVFNEASFVVTDKETEFIRVYSLTDNFCLCEKLFCECLFTPNTNYGNPLKV